MFQITELRGSEQVLKLEANKLRELLDYERKKYSEMESQVSWNLSIELPNEINSSALMPAGMWIVESDIFPFPFSFPVLNVKLSFMI